MLVLLPGCFYLGPLPTLEVNMPPEYEAASVDPGEVVIVPPYGRNVFVVYSDPDEDPLSFWWTLSADGPIGDAQPIATEFGEGSAVVLQWSEQLDGQTLSCYIHDGETERVLVDWPVEVQ